MQFDHVAQQVPDIAEAMAWWLAMVPGAQVLYEDETWGLLDAGGARLAFVLAAEHPDHLAWKVSPEELERLAAEHEREISPHRDGTRSFYLDGPGGHGVEMIAYPEELPEEIPEEIPEGAA
ncbi:MAG: VOC family protein [Solirubrobacterales bacterium]|nr:VOC family protein [Solirubrobacterales bacterium]